MSSATRKNLALKLDLYAPLFAALGDQTRLSLVSKLAHHPSQSISQLTEGSKITRQAVTKHLKVLEDAGLVRSESQGRENIFELDLRPFKNITEYLDFVSTQWDLALHRLKDFVEE